MLRPMHQPGYTPVLSGLSYILIPSLGYMLILPVLTDLSNLAMYASPLSPHPS